VFPRAKINSAITSLGRSRPAADASREVVERLLLDGVGLVYQGLRQSILVICITSDTAIANYDLSPTEGMSA
jgi:hypothetical protein